MHSEGERKHLPRRMKVPWMSLVSGQVKYVFRMSFQTKRTKRQKGRLFPEVVGCTTRKLQWLPEPQTGALNFENVRPNLQDKSCTILIRSPST